MPHLSQPLLPEAPPGIEILEAHWVSQEFYREVDSRQSFEEYCQWYAETAEAHRREFAAMQRDINIFGWFCRSRASGS